MSFVIYNRSQLPDTLSGLKAELNKTNNQLQKAKSSGRKFQLESHKKAILKKIELFKPSYHSTSSLAGRAASTHYNLPPGLSPFQSTNVKNDKGKEKDQSGEKELDNQPSYENENENQDLFTVPHNLDFSDEYFIEMEIDMIETIQELEIEFAKKKQDLGERERVVVHEAIKQLKMDLAKQQKVKNVFYTSLRAIKEIEIELAKQQQNLGETEDNSPIFQVASANEKGKEKDLSKKEDEFDELGEKEAKEEKNTQDILNFIFVTLQNEAEKVSGEKELDYSNDADNFAMLELLEATVTSSNEEPSGEKESDFDPKPANDFDTFAINHFFETYKEEAEFSSSTPIVSTVTNLEEISERTGLIATCQALYRKCISNPLLGQSLNPMLVSALVLLPTSFFLVRHFSPNLFDKIYKVIFGDVVQKALVKASEAGRDTISNAFNTIDLKCELPVGCTGYTFTAAILQFCDHWRTICKYLISKGHSVEWLEKHKQLPKDIALFLKELIGIHGKKKAFEIINQLKIRVWLFQGFNANWKELIQIDQIGAWVLKWALDNKLP